MVVFIVNAILGLILLFLTNLLIEPDISINIVTVLIVAIFGVLGWVIVLLLHLLGVAF
jgi:SigmaK-factor processing regulatory protein BofA